MTPYSLWARKRETPCTSFFTLTSCSFSRMWDHNAPNAQEDTPELHGAAESISQTERWEHAGTTLNTQALLKMSRHRIIQEKSE